MGDVLICVLAVALIALSAGSLARTIQIDALEARIEQLEADQ